MIPLTIRKNFISNILSKISSSFIQFFLVPVFIIFWGKEYYGEWLLISTIPGYLSATDFGLSVTSTTSLCSLIALKKTNDALELHKSTNKAFLILSFSIVSIYIISCVFLNWAQIIGSTLNSELTIEICVGFLLGSTFLSFFVGALLGVFRAENRFDKSQNFATVMQVIEALNTLTNLLIGGSFLTISISLFIIRICFLIFLTNNLSKKYQWFSFGFSGSIRKIYDLLPTSISYMIITMGQVLILQGTTFLVGKHLGSTTLVTFNTTRTLTNSIKSFVGIYYFPFLPEYTVLIVKEEFVKAKYIFLKMLKISFCLTIGLALLYMFLGETMMYYWTKGKVPIEYPFYLYMVIGVFFSTMGNCSYVILNATNKNEIIGIYYTFLSFIAILSIYYFVNQGLSIIALILLILELILFIVSLKEAWKLVNKK